MVLADLKAAEGLAMTSTADRFRNPQGSPGEVFVTAHRGAFIKDNHVIAAENSLPAIERARLLGCDMVEVDVHFTSDGTAVVIHDSTLDRTTTGNGVIAAQTYADLRALRLIHPGTGQPFEAHLPTLEEVFLALGPEMMINVECKTGIDAIPKIADIAHAAGVNKQVTVKTNSRGAAEISKVGDILAGLTKPVDFIPILIDQIDGVKTLQMVCETLPLSCVECVVELPYGPKGFYALERLGMTPDGGPLFSVEARRITQAHNVRQFINTLYVDPTNPGTQWNGGRNCQLGRISPDSVYSFWVAHGASVIQTDEPEFLLAWLRQNGFRLDSV
jgi:glycerophosphoryl diester phosphodiesterase